MLQGENHVSRNQTWSLPNCEPKRGSSLFFTIARRSRNLSDVRLKKCTLDCVFNIWEFWGACILVPRAYDPSGLRQETRALGATILK